MRAHRSRLFSLTTFVYHPRSLTVISLLSILHLYIMHLFVCVCAVSLSLSCYHVGFMASSFMFCFVFGSFGLCGLFLFGFCFASFSVWVFDLFPCLGSLASFLSLGSVASFSVWALWPLFLFGLFVASFLFWVLVPILCSLVAPGLFGLFSYGSFPLGSLSLSLSLCSPCSLSLLSLLSLCSLCSLRFLSDLFSFSPGFSHIILATAETVGLAARAAVARAAVVDDGWHSKAGSGGDVGGGEGGGDEGGGGEGGGEGHGGGQGVV